MYRYPANLKEARVHKLASKFGYKNPELKNKEKVHTCPCCENLISTMEIPLCYSTTPQKPEEDQDVFLVVTDASLYFIFIKMVIFYITIKFLIVDAFTIYAGMQGSYCTNLAAHSAHKCAYTISGYNLKAIADQHFLNIMDILTLVFVVFSIIYFMIFRKSFNKIRDWLDFNIVSQDDFTILVEGIPNIIYDEG